MQSKNKTKLNSKDLITIAIFSVLFAVVFFIPAMTLGMLPVTTPFFIPIAMIPNGIIWGYLRVKVPKAWAILVQCIVYVLMVFVLGAGWYVLVSSILGGIVAELVARIGKYKNFNINVLSYALMGAILNLGSFAPILVSADSYAKYCIEKGLSVEYVDKLLAVMSPSMLLLSTVLTLMGAWLGMWLGKIMLKKHFVKAGIV